MRIGGIHFPFRIHVRLYFKVSEEAAQFGILGEIEQPCSKYLALHWCMPFLFAKVLAEPCIDKIFFYDDSFEVSAALRRVMERRPRRLMRNVGAFRCVALVGGSAMV